jgi:hypothetical protein
MRNLPATLACALLASALAPHQAAAQIDQWPWTLLGTAVVGPDSLSLTSGTVYQGGSATVAVPDQGTLSFELHMSFTSSSQGSFFQVSVAGVPLLFMNGSDAYPFCSPAPCSAVVGTFEAHVDEGDVVKIVFDDPFDSGALIQLAPFTFTPDVGIVEAGGSLSGALLRSWSGPSGQVGFGERVVALDDVDGDGLGDVLVGNPFYDDGSSINFVGHLDAFSGATGEALWTAVGSASLPYLGDYIARAGDADGDGLDDVLVGRPLYQVAGQTVGAVEVRRGADGLLLEQYVGTVPLQGFGHGVAGLPDIDLDGTPDLAVGRIWDDQAATDAGSVVALSGATGGTLFSVPGPQAFAYMGLVLAAAGDVDADGTGDLAIGVPLAGRATVHSGSTGAELHLWTALPSDAFGFSLDGAGDVDGDGHGDVVVGAPQLGATQDGFARVFSGATGLVLFEVAGGGLAQADSVGSSVSGAGDRNGDGLADVLIGAPADAGAGAACLLAGPDGAELLHLASPVTEANFGIAVDAGFDTDGDGAGDLLIGAESAGTEGAGPGAVFLYSGELDDHVAPALDGAGNLAPGTPLALVLADGPPSGTCALVIGLAQAALPLKGGVLVPAADLVLAGLPLDAGGGFLLATTWPLGVPAGTEAWLQVWSPDDKGPQGWTASNALQFIAP